MLLVVVVMDVVLYESRVENYSLFITRIMTRSTCRERDFIQRELIRFLMDYMHSVEQASSLILTKRQWKRRSILRVPSRLSISPSSTISIFAFLIDPLPPSPFHLHFSSPLVDSSWACLLLPILCRLHLVIGSDKLILLIGQERLIALSVLVIKLKALDILQ